MKIIDYVTALRARTGTGSVYAAAKMLGVNEQTVRDWATGRRTPDADGCYRIAEALDVQLAEVIAAAEEERTKDEKKKAIWRERAKKAASSASAALLITIGTTGDNSQSGDGIRASESYTLQIMRREASRLCLLYTSPSPRD